MKQASKVLEFSISTHLHSRFVFGILRSIIFEPSVSSSLHPQQIFHMDVFSVLENDVSIAP